MALSSMFGGNDDQDGDDDSSDGEDGSEGAGEEEGAFGALFVVCGFMST